MYLTNWTVVVILMYQFVSNFYPFTELAFHIVWKPVSTEKKGVNCNFISHNVEITSRVKVKIVNLFLTIQTFSEL